MSDDSFTVDDFIQGYEAKTVSARVCTKAGLVAKHADLDAELYAARTAAGDVMRDPEVSRLRKEIGELEQRIAESEREFVFKSPGHLAWQNLKRKHPPTKEQRSDGLDVNVETFVVPAIAASAVRPKMSVEQANELATVLPEGEIQKLWRAALDANGETLVPKSVLAAVIGQVAQSDRSSTTAALAAFLGVNSSDANGDQSQSTPTTMPDD
jgi:hypothetical protein